MTLKRAIYLILILGIGLWVLSFIFSRLFYSTAQLTIEGPHDPVTAQVYVKDKKLYPSGAEGRTYILRSRLGNYNASISGPGLQPAEVSLNIKRLAKTTVTAKITGLSAVKAAADTIKPPDSKILSKVLVYGDGDWLVARLDSKTTGVDRELYILGYDYGARAWKTRASGVKFSIDSKLRKEAPDKLLQYIDANGGD